MIIKLLGSVFIVLSCSFLGLFFAGFNKNRVSQLLEMKKALVILKSEINFAYSTIPQACINISSRISDPVSSFFSRVVFLIKEKAMDNLSDIWNTALTDIFSDSYFANADIDAFKSFGTTLGFLDRNMQLSSIDLTVDYINQKVLELNEEIQKNSKMYQSLGVLSGLLLVVLFF